MKKLARYSRRVSLLLAGSLCGAMMESSGCLDSEISKRFREAVGPGMVSGLSAAIQDPTNAETGLREAGAALFDGLGAILTPRTPSSSGSSSSSTSGN